MNATSIKAMAWLSAVILYGTAMLTACSDAKTPAADTKNPSMGTTGISASAETEATTPEYQYPELDLGGAAIQFMNSDPIWDMNVSLDEEELTGETLDDAIYNRNRAIESRFNCVISVTEIASNYTMDDLVKQAYTLISAGDHTYDIMYLPVNKRASMMSEGCFYDLYDIPALHLDGSWWDQTINDSCTLGGSLYFAAGALHLMAFDGSWCLFFNEKMLGNLDLAMPYDLVKSGKWTIDRLKEYCTACANMGGQDSFQWDQSGDAVYGISTHPNAPDKFVLSAGERYVVPDKAGYPSFAANGTRFQDVVSKLSSFFSTEGTCFNGYYDDMDAQHGGYLYTFLNSRAAFLTAELKTAQLLRNMDDTFGIIPFPKYDETQENYRTAIVENLLVMTIPTTNDDPNTTAAVVDAMCYDSAKQVLPVYYDSTVSQKGLRNEESVEMLHIIRSTRSVDMAYFFGWNADLAAAVRGKITDGSGAVSSDIAAKKSAIEEAIQKTIKLFEEGGR